MAHRHAKFIDRVGKERVIEHFQVTPQTVRNWRKSGITKTYVKAFWLFAASLGVVE